MRDQFHAHLTLMMGDIPRGLEGEILQFLQEAEPVGPSSFMAEVCHLVAVASDDWRGHWWETMKWTILHSWKLGERGFPVAAPNWNIARSSET